MLVMIVNYDATIVTCYAARPVLTSYDAIILITIVASYIIQATYHFLANYKMLSKV